VIIKIVTFITKCIRCHGLAVARLASCNSTNRLHESLLSWI